jgi:hypothetical protein
VDTTALGRVLGEVIVTEEEAAALLEEVAAMLLPHAVKAANAMSDSAPKTFLINANISPSFRKFEQQLAGSFAGRQKTQFC